MLLRRYYEDYYPAKGHSYESIEGAHGKETVDYGELTVPQIKALLDARGVQYNARATKAQLIELLKG